MRQLLGCQRDNCIRAHSTAAGTTLQKSWSKDQRRSAYSSRTYQKPKHKFVVLQEKLILGALNYSNHYSMWITSLPSRFFSYQSGTYVKNFLALKTPPSSAGFTSIDPEPPRKNLRLSCTRSSHLLPDFLHGPLVSCAKPRATFCARTLSALPPITRHTSCIQ